MDATNHLDPSWALGDGARFSTFGTSRDQCMTIRVYPTDKIKVSHRQWKHEGGGG